MHEWYPHIHVIQPLWIRLMVGRQRKTPFPYLNITGVALISGGWKPIL